MRRRILAALAFALVAAPASAQEIGIDVAASPYDALIADAGAAYRELGDRALAVRLLSEAHALDPARPEAHNNLGVIGMESGDYALAEASFVDLARVARTMAAADEGASWYARAHDGLLETGGLLLDDGRFADARAVFERLLALYPESSDGRYNLGLALYELGENDALRDVARAMLEREVLSDAAWAYMEGALVGRMERASNPDEEAFFAQQYDDVRAQIESLPIRLDDILVQGGTITGVLIGGVAPLGVTVPVRFRFVGRDGTVGSAHFVFTAPGPGVETTFAFPVHFTAPATGWSYTIEQ